MIVSCDFSTHKKLQFFCLLRLDAVGHNWHEKVDKNCLKSCSDGSRIKNAVYNFAKIVLELRMQSVILLKLLGGISLG